MFIHQVFVPVIHGVNTSALAVALQLKGLHRSFNGTDYSRAQLWLLSQAASQVLGVPLFGFRGDGVLGDVNYSEYPEERRITELMERFWISISVADQTGYATVVTPSPPRARTR